MKAISMSDNKNPAFDVILEGGLVNSVQFHDPALQGLSFRVIDLDTEGASDDGLSTLERRDGTSVDIFYHERDVEPSIYKLD